MKQKLLDFIVCSACHNKLRLDVQVKEEQNSEIIEGELYCTCGRVYPIHSGIPIFVKSEIHNSKNPGNSQYDKIDERTIERFGFEWTKFSDYSAENFGILVASLPVSLFKDKLVLDAGCGAGRHMKLALGLEMEVIGIDFSESVKSAYLSTKNLLKAHVIQGNIYNLPFSPNTFDIIYSFGVLHHLPNPMLGFEKLVHLLKPNGIIIICVYQKAFKKVLIGILRLITTHIPSKILSRLALFCAKLEWILLISPYRKLSYSKSLIVRNIVNAVIPLRIKDYAKYDFLTCHTDWFDRLSAPISFSFSASEIKEWFKRTGLNEIEVSTIDNSWVRGCGRK
ncbi:MAG: methyltransferase domain-containing protein [Elusimicrobiota bacterium]